jgi:hypothetical protein
MTTRAGPADQAPTNGADQARVTAVPKHGIGDAVAEAPVTDTTEEA